MASPDNQMLQAALRFAKDGLPVFPLHTPTNGECDCLKRALCESPGKHPRTAHGLHDGTTDENQIRIWWGEFPEANIGIATGERSGLLVADVDGS